MEVVNPIHPDLRRVSWTRSESATAFSGIHFLLSIACESFGLPKAADTSTAGGKFRPGAANSSCPPKNWTADRQQPRLCSWSPGSHDDVNISSSRHQTQKRAASAKMRKPYRFYSLNRPVRQTPSISFYHCSESLKRASIMGAKLFSHGVCC